MTTPAPIRQPSSMTTAPSMIAWESTRTSGPITTSAPRTQNGPIVAVDAIRAPDSTAAVAWIRTPENSIVKAGHAATSLPVDRHSDDRPTFSYRTGHDLSDKTAIKATDPCRPEALARCEKRPDCHSGDCRRRTSEPQLWRSMRRCVACRLDEFDVCQKLFVRTICPAGTCKDAVADVLQAPMPPNTLRSTFRCIALKLDRRQARHGCAPGIGGAAPPSNAWPFRSRRTKAHLET